MNCKQAQELLPLHVGGDLEQKSAKLVSAHLHSCAACAGAAEAYHESLELVQGFAPPPFGEAVYAGIRQRVLREISQQSPNSGLATLRQLARSLYGPRFRLAATAALLLAVGTFALYFIAQSSKERQQLAHGGRELIVAPEKGTLPSSGTETLSNSNTNTMSTGRNHSYQSQRRRSYLAAAGRTTLPGGRTGAPVAARAVEMNSPDRHTITSQFPQNGINPVEPGAATGSYTSEKTLRVEMQTNDQNIRIIWFTRLRNQQDSPTEPSKGI